MEVRITDMTDTNPVELPQEFSDLVEARADYTPPTVRFRALTFSDGSLFEIDDSDIVVLVGPNNAGKSVALKELEDWVGGRSRGLVVESVDLCHTGTQDDFADYLEQHTQITIQGGSTSIKGPGFSVGVGTQGVRSMWPKQIRHFVKLFCTRVTTESRITESNPAPALATLRDMPSNPIQLLYKNDNLESTISKHFRKAFGQDLIVFRLGGSEIPLLVGHSPKINTGEDRLSLAYNDRLSASSLPLEEQGDGMRSFATVILRLLAPTTPSVLLLDEPEAFLHPPQARLLGEIIAQGKPTEAQLFIATHSPDVLHGLITLAPDNLRVLRMQRNGDTNRVQELEKELVKKLSRDPLMMQSSVMSGVFHERVIICEADADCMFYRTVLNLPEVHGGRYPDVLFVHANGKHRMATLASTLVQLGVPVDIIADVDILNDVNIFREVVRALAGGECSDLLQLVKDVKGAIEEHKPWLTGMEIRKGIEEILEQVPESGPFPNELRSKIREQFRKASPWDAVKQAGTHAIPSGEATRKFKHLNSLCKAVGLWIVPVGEVEGFCRSVSGHGPRWVQRVLEERDVENDAELEEARKFLVELWAAKQGGGEKASGAS